MLHVCNRTAIQTEMPQLPLDGHIWRVYTIHLFRPVYLRVASLERPLLISSSVLGCCRGRCLLAMVLCPGACNSLEVSVT